MKKSSHFLTIIIKPLKFYDTNLNKKNHKICIFAKLYKWPSFVRREVVSPDLCSLRVDVYSWVNNRLKKYFGFFCSQKFYNHNLLHKDQILKLGHQNKIGK
jgi:hypothetical protein